MKTLNKFLSIITLCFFTIQWGGVNAQLYPEPYIVDSLEDLRMIIYPITICDETAVPVDPPYGAPAPTFCTSTYCERNYRPTITILYDVSSSTPISADYKIEYRVHNLMPSFTTIDTGTISMSDCFKPWLFGTCNASYSVTDSLIDIYGTGMYKITVFDNQTSNIVTHTQYYVSPKYDTKFGLSAPLFSFNNPNPIGGNFSQYNTPSLTPYSFCNGNIKLYLNDEVLPNDNYTYCFDTVDQEYDCGPPLQLVVYSANSSGDIVSGYEDTITYQELFNSNTSLTYFNLNDLSNNRFVTHPGYYLIKSEYTGEGDFYLGDTLCGEYMADSWKFIRALSSNALDTKFETNGDLSSYDTLGSLNTYCDDIDKVEFSSSLITYATNNQNILTNNDLQVEVFTTDSTGNTATGTSVYQSNITVTEMINGEHTFSVLPKNKYYVFKISGASTACAANSESFLFVRNLAEDSLDTKFLVEDSTSNYSGIIDVTTSDTAFAKLCDSLYRIEFPQTTIDFATNNEALLIDGELAVDIHYSDSMGNFTGANLVYQNDISVADLKSGTHTFPKISDSVFYVIRVYPTINNYCFATDTSFMLIEQNYLDSFKILMNAGTGTSYTNLIPDTVKNTTFLDPFTSCNQNADLSLFSITPPNDSIEVQVKLEKYANTDSTTLVSLVYDHNTTWDTLSTQGMSLNNSSFFDNYSLDSWSTSECNSGMIIINGLPPGTPQATIDYLMEIYAAPCLNRDNHTYKLTISFTNNYCEDTVVREEWLRFDGSGLNCKTFIEENNYVDLNVDSVLSYYQNQINDKPSRVSNSFIYPNPTNGIFTISLNNDMVLSDISIIDITGKIINTYPAQSKDIDVTNLTNGVYFVTFETLSGKKTVKLIKK